MPTYTEGDTFTKNDFTQEHLPKGEYENCSFLNCNFADVDLSRFNFLECQFIGCNLSMANMNQLVLREVTFKDCKLLGLHFEHCNGFLLSVQFDRCILDLSSFFKIPLKKTKFIHTSLREVDFSECDMRQTIFDHCDLSNAIFSNTNLEKADLRTAFNYAIDPERNSLKKARFSMNGIAGLLHKYELEIE